MEKPKVRLSVDLPRGLVKQADAAVAQGAARSRNRLIAQAVETYLRHLEETLVDAQFAEMANDTAYQALAVQVSREFEGSDREAFDLGAGRR